MPPGRGLPHAGFPGTLPVPAALQCKANAGEPLCFIAPQTRFLGGPGPPILSAPEPGLAARLRSETRLRAQHHNFYFFIFHFSFSI